MIFDNLEQLENKSFFAIIVGSGPAGISLALKLEQKGYECLILEAGSFNYETENDNYTDGNVIGDNYNDLKIARSREFGGTSSRWGGNCSILKEDDFDDWPIKKSNLDAYIKDARKILNIRNDLYHKNFSENLDYFNVEWSNVSFKEKYFNHIKNSKKIFLSLDTIFCNLIGENGKIEKVKCYKNKFFFLKSKKVILSCGGIENSRLLLLSKEKNKSLFNFDLPIGKYFMDHPKHEVGQGILVFKKFKNFIKSQNIFEFPTLECKNITLSLNNKIIKNEKILNSGLELKLKRTKPNSNIIRQASCIAPNFVQNIYSSFMSNDVYEFTLKIIQEQFPFSFNRIALGLKKDPLGFSLPTVYWKKTPLLKKSAFKIINEFANILLYEDLGRLSINNNILSDENYKLTLGYHQLGGTRMGSNFENSVVDKNLLVHGFKNLYVNGSSVFTRGGFAYPTFTIVQLASRLGDHLSKV